MRRSCWFLLLLLPFSCTKNYYTVYANLETEPVASPEDAADDLAIYVHPSDSTKQALIGTNKQVGLVVYDNQGKAIHHYPVGRINNVDLRQRVRWGDQELTIIGGSNRTDNTLVFYRLRVADLSLEPLHRVPIKSAVNEVYGFCLYYDGANCYAFVVGKDGKLEQWLLQPDQGGALTADLVRNFDVGGQCEGLVADDELGDLYVGEEAVGVWKYGARPEDGEQRTAIVKVKEHPMLKADVEGLTLYPVAGRNGYLMVSSQGNNSYAIFTRQAPHTYVGSFRIMPSDTIEGTVDTDGIDVTPRAFGPYKQGVFVAQDGSNGKENQNFKLVDYRQIARAIDALEQEAKHKQQLRQQRVKAR